MLPGQGLAFEEPKLAAGTRAVLPRLRVLCVDECGNPTATLPAGATGLEARARLREVGLVCCVVWSVPCALCQFGTERVPVMLNGVHVCTTESQPLAFGTHPASAAGIAPGPKCTWPAAEGCWQQHRACLRRLYIR